MHMTDKKGEKPDLDILTVISSDEVRAAISATLLPDNKCSPYARLKEDVEKRMGTKLTDGKFNWHLKQLVVGNVIHNHGKGNKGEYELTARGRVAAEAIKNAL